jgi:hypothetical protein
MRKSRVEGQNSILFFITKTRKKASDEEKRDKLLDQKASVL